MQMMLRVVVSVLALFLYLQADEKSESALGTIVSFGEGKGIFYRTYSDASYLQHAGFALLINSDVYSFYSLMYGISYGKYLYSESNSKVYFKSVVGFETSVDYDSEHYQNSQKSAYQAIGMLSGGFGFEWGSRKRDYIVVGIDFLYLARATTAPEYIITPSAAAYIFYNF